VSENPRAVASLARSQPPSGAAAGSPVAPSPGHAGVTLSAEAIGVLGCRTARALSSSVLGDGGQHSWIYGDSFVRCRRPVSPVGGDGWYASQSAPESKDAVTTRRDRRWTCWDVPAKVKPSCYVLWAWVECRTNGCERYCWSGE
jgi:hypothetical protein